MQRWYSRKHLPYFEIPGGVCHLTWRLQRDQTPLTPDERTVVLETIRRDHGSRCELLAGAIMDDHAHILARVAIGVRSIQLSGSWKSISSHQLCHEFGRRAPLWQRDTYQRWIRPGAHLATCAAYIRANPSRRWPDGGVYRWVI